MPEEHCKHEDRWESVRRDVEQLQNQMSRDATALWVRWAIPLIVTLTVAVFSFVQQRIDGVEGYIQTRVDESQADRRFLASRTSELEVRQKEQFDRILVELQRLNNLIGAGR